MNGMQLEIELLGTGDAFGSGGRLQTCFLLRTPAGPLLLDCGTSCLVALKARGEEPNEVGWALITHLHGDHFGGLPFLILDGQFRRRERPLIVAGPPGIGERVTAAMEILFPGSSQARRRFEVRFEELREGSAAAVGPALVRAFAVEHPSGAPAYALRLECAGRVLAYSGDTGWTESLVAAARGSDLFLCEAYTRDKRVPYHLDLRTLLDNRSRLDCRRLIVTHMGEDMLAGPDEDGYERASDGLVLRL
jgi:ribonuclease BN (tRNA processing enzyme)